MREGTRLLPLLTLAWSQDKVTAWKRTQENFKKFCAFLEVQFCLVLLHVSGREL